ncbi:MAG: hypothetical protein HY822_12440 [Acidobacteria bacterium]|nr:hypothetical protein [Acidobacteriota bacterium]
MKSRIACLMAVCAAALAAQAPPTAILEIDTENLVAYYGNVFDMSKFGTDPNMTSVPGGPRTFTMMIAIGDIVAVNGRPARGIGMFRGQMTNLSPSPAAGQAIADIVRSTITEYFLEILDPDGIPIGSIFAMGVGSGSAPPGAPLAVQISNNTVVGGTGAFLGARGQLGGRTFPNTAFLRTASMTEDPANRRNLGGGKLRFVVHLIPHSRPEIASLPTGPAVYHVGDLSPVTADRPARAGEHLVLGVTDLGPVRPNLDPGQPCPPDSEGRFHEANSPVEVSVNGKTARVLNKIGWPGMSNLYRVDFLVPDGIAPGMATLGLSAAWIGGPEVRIPVR